MTERKPWGVLPVLLAVSGVIALVYFALLVMGALLGFLTAKSAPKTVEIIRYVSVASSTSTKPAPSAP
jgi:hypothetical protein